MAVSKYTGDALASGRLGFLSIDIPGTGSTSGKFLYGCQNISMSASKDVATVSTFELNGSKITRSTGRNYEISIDGLYLQSSISGETYTMFSGDSRVVGGTSPAAILAAFIADYTSKVYWKIGTGIYLTFSGVITAHDISTSEADPTTFSLTFTVNGDPTISAS